VHVAVIIQKYCPRYGAARAGPNLGSGVEGGGGLCLLAEAAVTLVGLQPTSVTCERRLKSIRSPDRMRYGERNESPMALELR
jgi:hypothetical protein